MKIKKLAVLIIGTMFFWNLHAGLVAHLEFEDNFKDRYGNNDGTNHGVVFTTGREGRGIYFNDSDEDYLEIGENNFDPKSSSGFSISLWVKSSSSNVNNNCYIGKNGTNPNSNEFVFGYYSNQLRIQIGDVAATASTDTEPFGNWKHYVIAGKEFSTYTAITVYRDGSQIWTGNINDHVIINSDSRKWSFGQEWDGSDTTDHFEGYMDNIRFYDKVITAEEVMQIYAKESSDLHLKFDDDYEDRVGSADGSPSNTGVDFIEGMENRAIDLSGSSSDNEYVEFGTNATDPRGTNGSYKDYSISLWVKSDAVGTNCYIGKHDDSGGNVFLLGYWSETLRLQISSTYATVSTTTEPTEWTHYVVTGRERLKSDLTYATDVQVYRNSSLIYSGTINQRMGAYPFTSGDYKKWVLGQDWDGSTPTDHFNGKIDNVRFYKRLLTSSEVQALYSSEFTGVRYCKFT